MRRPLVKLINHVNSCSPVHSMRSIDGTDDIQALSTWVATDTSLLTCYAKPSTRPSDGRLTYGGGSCRKLTCFMSAGNHGSCAWILVYTSQPKYSKLGCLRYGRLSPRRRSIVEAMLRPCDAACTVDAQSARRSTLRVLSASPACLLAIKSSRLMTLTVPMLVCT